MRGSYCTFEVFTSKSLATCPHEPSSGATSAETETLQSKLFLEGYTLEPIAGLRPDCRLCLSSLFCWCRKWQFFNNSALSSSTFDFSSKIAAICRRIWRNSFRRASSREEEVSETLISSTLACSHKGVFSD